MRKTEPEISRLERQIRYNIKTSTGEQDLARHRWTFMIINEPREVQRIKERIYEQLNPMDSRVLFEGNIPLSKGLHYDFFSFSSENGRIPHPEKIYKSQKFKKDRNLRECNEIQLDSYLNSIMRNL